ncbi:amino acid ABC transporter ATP-binding protein [Paenibacillus agilis]|uniref:Amino acid ABC transporter ATP-binding protein n=1 Tax=Paenibacillus agilis TaxID=3020863 RepID=A0A559IXZ9_9BACL|nr:amino acid ABC transporter ATP-binding protein [Paenibacillus agilis]TVX92486.1 amino acid ABC transporter ATP-binding protein [Paenibacillus agilis]
MIELKNVNKSFGNVPILKHIDLHVNKGETVVIIGPSGSGKSTLLRCLNLLEQPTSGYLRIANDSLQFKEGDSLKQADIMKIRLHTGMVFQAHHLFPHMTAVQNVMEGLVTVRRQTKAEARTAALRLLKKVGLADKADSFPFQLSGGQQQRVGIARALALEPNVLLFDEPTSALDPEIVGEVLNVMDDLKQEGMTMVIVTHEMQFARLIADHVVFLDQGVVIEEGSPDQVFDAPTKERTKQFLQRLDWMRERIPTFPESEVLIQMDEKIGIVH